MMFISRVKEAEATMGCMEISIHDGTNGVAAMVVPENVTVNENKMTIVSGWSTFYIDCTKAIQDEKDNDLYHVENMDVTFLQ